MLICCAGGDNVNLVPGFLENGLYAVRTFDSGSLATPIPDMGVARWYPTTCTLQDGTTLIAGGSTAEGGGYGSDSALNEPTYQVSSTLAVSFTCLYGRGMSRFFFFFYAWQVCSRYQMSLLSLQG